MKIKIYSSLLDNSAFSYYNYGTKTYYGGKNGL
jgi:hypothetical protein